MSRTILVDFRASLLAVISVFSFAPLLQASSGATFVRLDSIQLPSIGSAAWAVSADSLVVVGSDYSDFSVGVEQAFRWTVDQGPQGLGLLPGTQRSRANAVSADGTVIVGSSNDVVDFDDGGAFRWTSSQGMMSLGTLPDGRRFGAANGVSGDGDVIVGGAPTADGKGNEAVRWTSAGGAIGLGDLPGGEFNSMATGVSADGSVIAGWGRIQDASSSGSIFHAFRWTEATGMVALGDLPGGNAHSTAYAISDDGTTIVGLSSGSSGVKTFRWTQSTGMISISPGSFFQPWDVSGDGSVVVGSGPTGDPRGTAVIWDAINGQRSLAAVLEDVYGVSLGGWTLEEASGISADGTTIVGWGFSPDEKPFAWVAVIPEPTMWPLLAIGLLAFVRRVNRL